MDQVADDESDSRIIFILDESGSMSAYRREAIRGYNDFLVKTQMRDVDADLTLAVFSGHYTKIVDGQPLHKAAPITGSQYRPHGGTLLWDTVGDLCEGPRPGGASPYRDPSLLQLSRGAKAEPKLVGEKAHLAKLGLAPEQWGEQATDDLEDQRTLVVILTDGYDTNSTRRESDAREMIDRLEATGLWTFVFLAAGHAKVPAWFKPGNALDFAMDRLGTVMDTLAEATAKFLESDDDSTETFFLTEGRP